MSKKELRDIILKTLEKEGGAAGLKALAKAAKTSKNKLKKDLDDMSGVKQHQDGDYISTPLNEGPLGAAKACKACMENGQCCLIYGSTDEPLVACIPCPDDMPIEQGKISGGGGVYTQGKNPQLANIVRSAMDREMRKEPMRIREVKEIIEVMLDEKKKKKKDRCHRKADSVYGTKTSAYKSGAIVKCRKGMIWKVGGKKKK